MGIVFVCFPILGIITNIISDLFVFMVGTNNMFIIIALKKTVVEYGKFIRINTGDINSRG